MTVPAGAANRGFPELEREVLVRCRARDPAALRLFVSRYQRMVFAYLSRSMGPGVHVEDMAQDVFLRASQALSRFDPDGPARLSTWLLTIASHVAADVKKRRGFRLVDTDEVPEAPDSNTPEREARRHEIGTAPGPGWSPAFRRAPGGVHPGRIPRIEHGGDRIGVGYCGEHGEDKAVPGTRAHARAARRPSGGVMEGF